jgi:hypothetical protein
MRSGAPRGFHRPARLRKGANELFLLGINDDDGATPPQKSLHLLVNAVFISFVAEHGMNEQLGSTG